MTIKEKGAGAGPGTASMFVTTIIVVLLAFTLLLVLIAFPAGLYAVFHGGLSTQLSYDSYVHTYLWLGPSAAALPFTVPIGGTFLALLTVYACMFLLGFVQLKNPLSAIRDSYSHGVGSLLSSPFIVILVGIGFLNFTAGIIVTASQAIGGSVGNPFAGVDPLLEFASLTFAPLREEFGFRLLLIGLVAFVLSIGKPPREALKSLWRPSAAYEGALVGGAASTIIWIATAASAATFGVCHVNCGGGGGWDLSKLPEAVWGGLVLGYLYVRYGFHVAVLAHWGIDYFSAVFLYFGQVAYGIPAGSTTTEFVGQYLVGFDMTFLFGLASFLLVTYLAVRKVVTRRGQVMSLVDKDHLSGGVAET